MKAAKDKTRKQPQDTAMAYKPTFWQRIGFGECCAPCMEDEDYPDFIEGRMIVDTYIILSWPDRLRCFLSGKLICAMSMKTDVFVKKSVSTSKVSILPPNFKPRQPVKENPNE